MATNRFTQLEVWKTAHQAVLDVYLLTRTFPDDERFVLTSQMRRAAMSVPANIAEGYGRRRPLDKARLYTIGQGSNEELSYYLIPHPRTGLGLCEGRRRPLRTPRLRGPDAPAAG